MSRDKDAFKLRRINNRLYKLSGIGRKEIIEAHKKKLEIKYPDEKYYIRKIGKRTNTYGFYTKVNR